MPAFFHLAVFGIVLILDTSHGNPGAMAGPAWYFFLVIITAPTMILLLTCGIIQAVIVTPNYKKYLKLNIFISILPMLLVVLLVVFDKLLT